MSRTMKFRAWHTGESVMLYDKNVGDSFRWLNEGQPVEVMQYTGLKDCNGKEIYEGDIHRLDEEVGTVEYHEGTYFVLGDCVTRFLYQELTEKKGEVIGNVYENAELLELA